MNPKARLGNAERLGRWLGGVWRGYLRRERRAAGWLVAHGLPAGGAWALLWAIKLGVFALLLYVAFWLALLLLFALAGAWAIRNGALESDEPETEWRTGWAGFGLYRGDIRVDLGDPDEDD